MIWKLLLVPVVLYAALLLVLFFAQGSMLFPARMVQGARALPSRAERLVVETPDGEHLHGLLIRSAGREEGVRPLILGFGGNAWNAEDGAAFLADLLPAHDVAMFHYRGYRPSSGRASGPALLRDGLLLHDELVRRYRPASVLAVGFSVGTGVASRLARERPLAGLVLVTPFDSLAAVAADQFPWLPVRLLFRHEMPAASDLAASPVPVALIAAGRDDLILPPRTEALRRRVRNLVLDRTIAAAGHNDIAQHPEFATAMDEALDAVTRR